MRLLDRYLLRELLAPFGYCLGAFLVFWVSFDLFQELSELNQDRLKWTDMVEYYLWRMPELLSTVLPVSLLLAMLYSLTRHARHHELTAIRAAGVSLWRLSLPYLAVGVLCSLWLLAVSEIWAPRSAQEAGRIRKRYSADATGPSVGLLRNFGFRSGQGRVWQMDTLDLNAGEMRSVHVGWKLDNGGRREIVARRAEWRDDHWHFQEVVDTTFDGSPAGFPERSVAPQLVVPFLTESPEQIRAALKVNELFSNLAQAAKRPQLSVAEILNYRRLFPDDRQREGALMTQLHGRLAAPWTCLVVVLIAIPFGAPSGRRNPFVGVAASVFICFAYFVLLRLGLSLGTGGRLPGWLAAWGPNLAFAAAGIWMTCRVR